MLLGAALLLLTGCAPTRPAPTDTTTRPAARPTTTAAAPAADPLVADVARFRPKIEPAPPVTRPTTPTAPTTAPDDTERADNQLAAWTAANQQIKSAPGFRILAYTGNSRDDAMRIRTAVIRRDPTEHDYLLYEQPTFRLKIGDYFSRLEAEQALARWRDVIPQGLIVAEPVNVR